MADLMEGAARTRLVALVMLLAVSVPLTIVAVVGSGGGDEEEGEAGIRIERSPNMPEMVVFMTPEGNTPERTGGRKSVTVECLDTAGRVLSRQDETWPFTDTDRGTLDPHVHVPVNPARINDVARCRVLPADPPLEGPVS
jgi:hypothetical protein